MNYIVYNICYMVYKIECYILKLAYKNDHINIFTYFMVLTFKAIKITIIDIQIQVPIHNVLISLNVF